MDYFFEETPVPKNLFRSRDGSEKRCAAEASTATMRPDMMKEWLRYCRKVYHWTENDYIINSEQVFGESSMDNTNRGNRTESL